MKDPKIEDRTEPKSKDSGTPSKNDVFIKVEEVEDEEAVLSSATHANRPLKDEPLIRSPSRSPFDEGHYHHHYPDDDSDNDYLGFYDDPRTPRVDFRDSDDDMYMDLDDMKHPLRSGNDAAPPPNLAAPLPAKADTEEPGWKSVNQLVQFRQVSAAIAEDFLKEKGIKLSAGRADRWELRHDGEWQIYNQGREDAKKIDVKRKRITDKEGD